MQQSRCQLSVPTHPSAQSDGWPDRVFCYAVRLYPSEAAVQSAKGVN